MMSKIRLEDHPIKALSLASAAVFGLTVGANHIDDTVKHSFEATALTDALVLKAGFMDARVLLTDRGWVGVADSLQCDWKPHARYTFSNTRWLSANLLDGVQGITKTCPEVSR